MLHTDATGWTRGLKDAHQHALIPSLLPTANGETCYMVMQREETRAAFRALTEFMLHEGLRLLLR